jgi:hypothetical protein
LLKVPHPVWAASLSKKWPRKLWNVTLYRSKKWTVIHMYFVILVIITGVVGERNISTVPTVGVDN